MYKRQIPGTLRHAYNKFRANIRRSDIKLILSPKIDPALKLSDWKQLRKWHMTNIWRKNKTNKKTHRLVTGWQGHIGHVCTISGCTALDNFGSSISADERYKINWNFTSRDVLRVYEYAYVRTHTCLRIVAGRRKKMVKFKSYVSVERTWGARFLCLKEKKAYVHESLIPDIQSICTAVRSTTVVPVL